MIARRFVPVCCPKRTARYTLELANRCDVFLGCAPRTSNKSGTLKDIERVWCLWADCDSEESAQRLREVKPRPSLVVRSSPGRYHAYWAMSRPLTPTAADRGNRRLMRALGSDRCTDATRVLRPVGSINHKHGTTLACVRLEFDVFTLGDVVGKLEDDERYLPRPTVERHHHGDAGGLVATVASAQEGSRNNVLYWAARRAADEGTFEDVRGELADAAVSSGLDERGVQATLLSAERATC